ncbi:MAG: hypothetical protein U0791_06490 [Gemmataceae bacterium]
MPHALRSLAALLLTSMLLVAAFAWQQPEVAPAPRDITPLPPLPAAHAGPQFWKGNLHTHSLWSDGDDFPEMIADWYKRNGYHFLALTDHNLLSEGDKWVSADANATRTRALKKYAARFGERWVETREKKGKREVRLKPLAEFRSLLEEPGRFLLIQAEEITHSFAKRPIHINGINLRDAVKPIDGKDAIETITVNMRQVSDQRKKTGRAMIAFLNHPNFGWGVRAEELLLSEELKYFEVFNGHPGVGNYGDTLHASTERVWDVALALRLGKHQLPVVYGLATDDSHGYHEFGVGKVNPGRGWVMVNAPHPTAEAIVKGLEAGDFHASTGVLLKSATRKGNQFRVEVQEQPGVQYKIQFIGTLKDADLSSQEQRDKDGNPLPVTNLYSADIGKVLGEADGPAASYGISGRELYVRAKVISTKPHPNPYTKGDLETAWTQPIVP